MAVHQVLGGIGLGLVQRGIAVDRGLYGTMDSADIQDVVLAGGKLEFADAGGYVADLHLLAELVALQGGFPDLSALDEVNLLAVERPTGIGDALGVTGELDLV